MPKIQINKFSCIDYAELDLKKVNVIIGPQGSGKSLIAKLTYFMGDIIISMLSSVEDELSLKDFEKRICKSFIIWFPPSAWGGERFLINYTNGNFSVRILRRKTSGNLTDEVTVKFSKWFEGHYKNALAAYGAVSNEDELPNEDEDYHISSALERSYRIRSKIWGALQTTSGEDVVQSQMFIPAGRAFFTSIGRMVAGIEHAGSLDPATLRFARLFASWRDRSGFEVRSLRMPEFQSLRRKVMREFFGGLVQSKRESEYIEMDDGRRVPFSSLSSGQQELLPIWYFLDSIMSANEIIERRPRGVLRKGEIIYIEEPEAHLFPDAQSNLVDVLVSNVVGRGSGRKLIVTTHSPYIMMRLNVLLKAGAISRRRKRNKKLGSIVPRDAWIDVEDFNAVKISNGRLSSIIDEEEGLVDAEFLDGISDSISRDFDELLDLEDLI